MNGKDIQKPPVTNFDNLTDEMIDVSESPPLSDDFFEQATWRMPEPSVEVTEKIVPNVLNKEEIITQIQTALHDQPDLVAAYLFGSLAEGLHHAQSDIDVAVLFIEGLEPATIFQRTLEIGTVLEHVLPHNIDVVALNRAGPLLCFQVIQKGEVILQRDETARCLFHVRATNLYFDAKPFFDYQQEITIRRIREKGLGSGYQGHRNALTKIRSIRERFGPVTASATG